MDLSIIILSYNTSDLTKDCLNSVVNSLKNTHLTSEIIVIDNASSDDSVKMLKGFVEDTNHKNIHLKMIFNEENAGFTKGNNQGVKVAKGKYILLLNSDAVIEDVDFAKLLEYLDSNKDVGILTVRLNLPDGEIDPASHRGFPTPWNSLTYFLKLEKIFGKLPFLGKTFGGYHQTFKNLQEEHEIDSPTGAFFLTRKSILVEVNGFDEDYFMYGEDLDLAYRIKKKGYKVIYYPYYTALHKKHHSGIKGVNFETRKKTRKYFYEAMKIFYKKNYDTRYPFFIRNLIYFLIDYKMDHL